MSAVQQIANDQAIERQLLIRRLRQSRDCFAGSLADVPEELCRVRPSDISWSVIDCVEHIVIAENAWHVRLQGRQPVIEPIDRAKDEFVNRVADRTEKRSAPERAQPKGKHATLAEATREFAPPGNEPLLSRRIAQKTSGTFRLSMRLEYSTFTNFCCWQLPTRNVMQNKSKRSKRARPTARQSRNDKDPWLT